MLPGSRGFKDLAHRQISYAKLLVTPNHANSKGSCAVMNSRQLVALAGTMALLIGVFGPIVSVPILGTMNYFQNGRGDGVFIILLAIASAVFAFNKRFGHLWWTASGSLGVMLFTFLRFQSVFSSLKRDIESTLEGNLFRGLAEAAVGGVQLGWGWAPLLIGVALLFIAAAMKEAVTDWGVDLLHERGPSVSNADSRQCPHCAELVRAEAKICRFCQRDLPPLTALPEQAAAFHGGSGRTRRDRTARVIVL